MRLELADFPVKDVRFGERTGYHNGVLEIDKEEMIEQAIFQPVFQHLIAGILHSGAIHGLGDCFIGGRF